jgi:hypothetical protein
MLNGEQRLRLIQELAEGSLTLAAAAEKYGYSSTQAVATFKSRNREAIEKAKQGFEDEMELLWITRRTARVAQYQTHLETLEDVLDKVDPDKVPNVVKTANHVLRSVAEEMGHLNQKDTSERLQVDVHLHGVDGDV